MKLKATLLGLIAVLGLGNAIAGEFANSVPAVQGYDVVSYQTGKRPVRGSGHFTAEYQGATYQFASAANRDRFESDPARYAPAYGGYCAFGVSVGKKFIGDPEVWRVVDGRLYLNLDASIQDDWLKDTKGRIEAADRHWAKIRDKDPANL